MPKSNADENIDQGSIPRQWTRREWGITVVVGTIGLALGLSVLSDDEQRVNPENISLNFDSELLNLLTDDQLEIVTNAAQSYVREFGCPIPDIRFAYYEEDLTIKSPDGVKSTTLEFAEPGIVYLTKSLLSPLGDIKKSELNLKIRDTILHSFTHACQIKPTIFTEDQKFYLDSGDLVLGVSGLSLLVQLSNGEMTAYRRFEEAAAELLAIKVATNTGFGYTILSNEYEQLALLLDSYMQEINLSHEDLSKLVQTNGLLEFIAKLSGKLFDPNALPKNAYNDLIRLMKEFQN